MASEWDDDVAWFDSLVDSGLASGLPCPHCGNNTVWRLWGWGPQSGWTFEGGGLFPQGASGCQPGCGSRLLINVCRCCGEVVTVP